MDLLKDYQAFIAVLKDALKSAPSTVSNTDRKLLNDVLIRAEMRAFRLERKQ